MLLENILRQTLVASLSFALMTMMGCVYDPEQRSFSKDSEGAQAQKEQPPELPERPAEPQRGNIIRR